MTPARLLRARFVAVLAGSVAVGALPLACNSVDATKEDVKPSCNSGSSEVQCFAPGTTHFNTGETLDPPPPPTPQFDANNCQVREQVRDGCCIAATTGPELIDGECCYGFCTGVCCGRPFLVNGEARVAPVVTRSDWLEPLAVQLAGLSARERATLALEWQKDAQLEHASVASFARFILDLLAFGAPAELVEGAERAMSDEIEHARLCFGLASAYAGAPLGPSVMNLQGVAPSASLAAAAAAAVREGAINETIAALAATEQAGRATDPTVRHVLERIARDEANHAELAWRFVHWALAAGDVGVRSAVQAALSAHPTRPASLDDESPLRSHGRLTPPELDAIANTAWTEVIAPCGVALA
jgi:hypothetical protein